MEKNKENRFNERNKMYTYIPVFRKNCVKKTLTDNS